LTRKIDSIGSNQLLTSFPAIKLIEGSYTTEAGLRAAFANQDVAYFNIDSFNVGEPDEYFWTFRAYEIAVQSGLKLFIYAGAADRFGSQYHFDEKYRNSHNIVGSRLTGWLTHQPLERLPWTIITGGVYAETLNSLLRPRPRDDGSFVFNAPVDQNSVIPLIPLDNYGQRVKWALEHPQESSGQYLSASPFQMTFSEIATALQNVIYKKVDFEPVSIDDWMIGITPFIGDPSTRMLPRGASVDDPTAFTFRKSFGAWWNIWKDNRTDLTLDSSWADQGYLFRPKTLEDWMRAVQYDPTGPLASLVSAD
jgi:hypothetical protein